MFLRTRGYRHAHAARLSVNGKSPSSSPLLCQLTTAFDAHTPPDAGVAQCVVLSAQCSVLVPWCSVLGARWVLCCAGQEPLFLASSPLFSPPLCPRLLACAASPRSGLYHLTAARPWNRWILHPLLPHPSCTTLPAPPRVHALRALPARHAVSAMHAIRHLSFVHRDNPCCPPRAGNASETMQYLDNRVCTMDTPASKLILPRYL